MFLFVWSSFILLVILFLALDLGIFHKKDHVISISEAIGWTIFWILVALIFNFFIYFFYEHNWLGVGEEIGQPLSGKNAALKFFTGYILEKSLSLDNIFVIAMIFSYFNIPDRFQHRVLFWGIIGALMFRGIMIGLGAALIQRFDWVIYVFGAFLIFTAIKMLFSQEKQIDPDKNPLVHLARKFYPVSNDVNNEHFFTRIDGKKTITPLFLVLLVIESSDILFAIDSIPAIFSITYDPFIVFTSNVFAILGLRSLYFALAGLIRKFKYLKLSLVFLLGYVGVKMLLTHHYPIPTAVSLSIIGGILSLGIIASVIHNRREGTYLVEEVKNDYADLAGIAWKQIRKIVILILGTSVLLVGLAFMVLPGPATVVIPLGLGILGTEFVWAKKLLNHIKTQTASLVNSIRGNNNKP